MYEPAGVVENLVQNSTEYPYSAIQLQNTPPKSESEVAEYPPIPKIQIYNFFS